MILILGVTASGKSSLAHEMAVRGDGEIVSVDSMKVYRRMDIGTAKPSAERRAQVPYHCVDVVEPGESFSVDQFLDLAHAAIGRIRNSGRPVVAVGGTAMYIKALLFGIFEGPGGDEAVRGRLKARIEQEGLPGMHEQLRAVDPEAADRIHPNDARRIVRALEVYELTGRPISSFQQQWSRELPSDWTVIGLRRPKETESQRINERVRRMMEAGLVDEVRCLLAEPRRLSEQARAAIGYAEMIEHLEGRLSLEEAVERIKINTRKLAKAQRTWFKTFRGVHWIDIGPEDTLNTVLPRATRIAAGNGQ